MGGHALANRDITTVGAQQKLVQAMAKDPVSKGVTAFCTHQNGAGYIRMLPARAQLCIGIIQQMGLPIP